ncbi:rhomboid family intramembrane serine protease [Salinirarus marinus]|uniref:rhomboid family intramembrane serine protease n=1 Tax=Salinirarus marinus TaxID=3068310 RepID=UPI003C6C3A61
MVSGPNWALVQRLAVVVAFVLALVVVAAVDRSSRSRVGHLRTRLLLGVPWGTLTTLAVVTSVYLFLQGGWSNWHTPVVVPFRAWSYFYPLGVLSAAFAHVGAGHLVGNLVGTLAFGALAEYAWGHFPRSRGASTFSSWRTNPYVRAFVVVPSVAVAVGLVTAAFSIGPIIGFSGVVFAFAGFALVYYPLGTVVTLSAGGVVRTVYRTLRSPTVIGKAEPVYSSPWWADVAIQGHALGLFVGVLLGLWVARRRGDDPPSPLRLWSGVVLFAVAQSLWAVYWYRGSETYVLYRAVGVVAVALLATLVTLAVTASDRPLFDAPADALRAMPRWQAAAVAVVLVTAAISGPAVPVNLSRPADDAVAATTTVRDYEVTYAENLTNRMVSAVDVSALGETTNVTTSGVVVESRRRSIWTTAVTKGRLDFAGDARVRLGGVGWRETVGVHRDGWDVVGNDTVYRVSLSHDGRNATAYTSPPKRAEPVVAGRNVSVVARPDRFLVNVTRANESASAPVPANDSSVTLLNVTLVRNGTKLFATHGETRVRVANEETYPANRAG